MAVKEEFVAALDDIFNTDAEIHGNLVDITGLIGQYVHGNEPSHHIAYLYNYVGEPWKTQKMSRRLLNEMYHPIRKVLLAMKTAADVGMVYSFKYGTLFGLSW